MPNKSGKWSQPEISQLKKMYGSYPLKVIAARLERSQQSVQKQLTQLFPEADKSQMSQPWSAVEIQRLRGWIGGQGDIDSWARLLKRSAQEIQRKISALKQEISYRDWSRESLQKLKEFYGSRSNKDLEVILGMPTFQIEEKAKALALSKDKKFLSYQQGSGASRMPRWSREEEDYLRQNYHNTSNQQLGNDLKRSAKSIQAKAGNLGLKKNLDHLQEMGRDNVDWRYRPDTKSEAHNE
mgnify:CR=1 FL=1